MRSLSLRRQGPPLLRSEPLAAHASWRAPWRTPGLERALLPLLAVLLACAGCAATPVEVEGPPPPGDRCVPASASTLPEAGAWLAIDAATGCVLDRTALAARLAGARVVYVGEQHDVAAHHAFQAEVVELVLAGSAEGAVLVGFEMFNPSQQPVLEQWSDGALGTELARFLEAVDWAGSWKMDPALYAPLLMLGPRDGVRFVGLNAPRRLSRRVFEVGLDGLEPPERAELPAEFDLSDAGYRAYLREALLAHGHGVTPDESDPQWQAMEQRFVEAQLVWDESMAENLAAALRSSTTPAVVVAGGGHVQHRWGIPQRVQRRLGSVDDLVIVCEAIADEASWPTLDPARAEIYCLTRR